MKMTLLGGIEDQKFISNRLPMPVDVMADTAYVQSITGETVQLYYFNAGVVTTDAGQAAGTLVVAKLAYTGILDSLGAYIGNNSETSLAWTTNTVLPTASRQPLRVYNIESAEYKTLSDLATAMTSGFTNGQRCLDHRTGLIFGVKATTGTSDTAAYKVMTSVTGGGTTVTESVNVAKIANVAVPLDNAAIGSIGILPVGAKYNSADQTYDNGDVAVLQVDSKGKLKVTGGASSVAAEYMSPSDFTATYTSNVTITLAGLPMTITDSSQIVYIKYIPTGGSGSNIIVNGSNGATITHAANVLTVNGAGTPFASGDVYEVGINAQKKAYDSTLDVTKTSEQSPLWSRYVENNIVDTTNVAATTNYYPSATGAVLDGYKDVSFTGKMIDADGTMTLSLQAMNDEDTTSGDWQTIYFYDNINNTTVNSITVTNGTVNFACSCDNLNFRNYRYVMVNNGATNTLIIKERESY